MDDKFTSIVHLFHEIGMLSDTPRSGFAFLGSGKQSVAEHSFRTALIALFLAEVAELKVDEGKLLKICLLHDLPEARIGDQNYVNKHYVDVNLDNAIQDLEAYSPCGLGIAQALRSYEESSCIEAQLAHEADKLELLLCLKCESEVGNSRALDWFEKVQGRLTMPIAQEIACQIKITAADRWWRKLFDKL